MVKIIAASERNLHIREKESFEDGKAALFVSEADDRKILRSKSQMKACERKQKNAKESGMKSFTFFP